MRILALIASLFLAFTAWADTVQLREDAPDRHVVVKGDTLWDISAKFLKSPWLWPELWAANKEAIKNPHLIYPGDVVYLTMTPQGPRLGRIEGARLSPSVHAAAIPSEAAISTIPYGVVQAFLQRPLVAGTDTLKQAPTLVASEDGRVMLTTGDRVYATGMNLDARDWHIVRLGKSLKDPDSSSEIAREVEYVGDARTVTAGTPAVLSISHVEKEVLVGDRLLPALAAGSVDFLPRAPDRPVAARIISAYGGAQGAGKYSTVVINKGRADGIEIGHVLAVFREGRTLGKAPGESRLSSFDPKSGYIDAAKEREGRIAYQGPGEEAVDLLDPFDFFFKPYPDGRRGWRYLDYKCLPAGSGVSADQTHDPAQAMVDCPAAGGAETRKWAYLDIGCLKPGKQISFGEFFDPRDVYEPHCRPSVVKLPDVRTGLVMVYRVFDRVAYALVMESTSPLYLLDSVRNP